MVTYCAVGDVSALTGITFPSGSTPGSGVVETIITMNEQFIDTFTRDSWRSTTVTDEFHDFPSWRWVWSRYRDQWGAGYVQFNFSPVRTMDASAGDGIFVWNGSAYENYLTAKTEGRANDYWVDYNKGLVHFENSRPTRVKDALYLNYHRGYTIVPEDIKYACALLTARQVLLQEDYNILFPEGGAGVRSDKKLEEWEKRAMDMLERRQKMIFNISSV